MSRRATRPRGRGARRPPKADSALSRTAQRVRRRNAGRVPVPEGGKSRTQAKRGRDGRSEDFGLGLLKNVRGLGDRTLEGRKARPQSRTRPRGRDGDRRGHKSAPGRQAAESKWSGGCRTSCRRPWSAFGAHFSGKIQRAGAISGPERAILNEKWAWKARTDKRQRKSAVLGGFVRRA